ncbi:MAG: nuclear transport factor 2 family protein [Oculatellaceae cyanobacterium Prado106]|jgi:ketosteroid isomerase-like protein|nr:nuclear transport factor 2 family protein [Oculatellaceae cyanobacterium Prado106]
MQSNEPRYRDQIQQDDFFNADLTDAAVRNHAQSDQTVPSANHQTHPDSLAERFMQLLQQMEATQAVEPLVSLFAEDADVINLAMSKPLRGQQQIRQFWQNYLSVFDRIQSRFTHVAEGKDTITLEWISEGALASGEPFSYRGVSILETKQSQVQHFRTYYDSATFLPQGAK